SHGAIFKVAAGTHAVSTVAPFTFSPNQGSLDLSDLIVDASGNILGTTEYGGTSGYGTVFKVAAGSNAITILASFNGIDGGNPTGRLMEDGGGNLFGITALDGGYPRVFELAAGSTSISTRAAIDNDTPAHPAGSDNQTGVIVDPSGNAIGTT